jgi:hypothetical protein
MNRLIDIAYQSTETAAYQYVIQLTQCIPVEKYNDVKEAIEYAINTWFIVPKSTATTTTTGKSIDY